jgi:transglutaminase-like putative cysteine protease
MAKGMEAKGMEEKVLGKNKRFDRVVPLLALLFLIDVLAVFKGYWWSDTYNSVYWSLICITAINMVFPNRHLSHRIPLDLLIGIVIMFRVTWHRQPELVEHFYERFSVIQPFAEIVLSIILILMLLERLAVTKQRLILVFAIGLLILSIRDSFSPLRLWLNIAFLVVLFLIWHTLLHYRSLDSATLTKLMKRPAAVFSPVVAVLLIITVIGFSLPHGPPLLEDPYALWKKSRGESIPAFIGDKGYATNNGLKLMTTSGYSRDNSQLGGGFNYDYTPVLNVKTSQKGYLRGETKAIYDGKGWIDSEELELLELITLGGNLPYRDEADAQYVDVEQHITVLEKRSIPVLFVNGIAKQLQEMVYYRTEQNSEDMLMQALSQGNIINDYVWEHFSNAIVMNPATNTVPIANYTVHSQALIIESDGLKASSASLENSPQMLPQHKHYMSVPDVVPTRVHELAATVTAAGSNDYERALLLEQHLRMNYMYTNTPDVSLLSGQSDDFVDQFLFELQEGYCDYFSTAMVIMARTLGMPARWVKGYTSGINEQDQFMLNNNPFLEEQYEPSNSGTFTVRNSDAHSWVEIYFEGYGWVAFEPTPGFSIPQQYGEQQIEDVLQNLLPSSPPITDSAVAEVKSSPLLTAGQKRLIVWSSTLLLLGLISALLLYHRKTLAAYWRNLRYLSYNNNGKIVEETNALLKKGKRRGLPVSSTATMRETLLEWSNYYPTVTQQLDELLHAFEMASYSKTAMSDEQVEEVRKVIEIIKQQWKK